MIKKLQINNVTGLQLFQLIRYGALLLIGILLAKSGLSKEQIGQYEMFLLVAGSVSFFWVNGFVKALMLFAGDKSSDEKKVVIFNAFVLISGFALMAAVLVLLLNNGISKVLLNGSKIPMPWALAGFIVLNCPAMLTEYFYLLNNKVKTMVLYGLLVFSLQVLAVGIPTFFGLGLNYTIAGLAFTTFVKYMWLVAVLLRYSTFALNKEVLITFVKLGLPLILSILFSASAQYIDGFIITSKFSADDFAIFQYGARELPLALLLANSISLAMLPKFSGGDLNSSLSELKSEANRLIWIASVVSIILVATSHWFYPIVFSDEFKGSASIFNIYLLLVMSRVLFPQTILIGHKLNHIIVRASFFEILVNVAMSLWLAAMFGIKGVAYATLIAFMFEKVYLAIACYRKLKISPKQYLPIKPYLISSALLAIVFIFVEFKFY